MAYLKSLKTTGRRGTMLHLGMLLACSMGLAILCDQAGVSDAIDGTLESTYFSMRGQRSSSDAVVLVSLDENTVARWGAPPWSWQRFDALISSIADGEPALIAVMEHGPRVLSDSAPDPGGPVARAQASGILIMPSPERLGRPALRMDTGVVRFIELRDHQGRPSLMARVVDKADLHAPASSWLSVNYLGPTSSLPTVAAHRVASGEIPVSTFAGRIVVIGLQGERFAPLVPTPVGPMSPAEVQAHAITGLVDGVVWRPMPPWLRWLIIALVCALILYLVPRVENRVVFITAATVVTVALAVDYSLFAAGVMRVNAALFLLAAGFAITLAGLVERGQTRTALSDFSRWFQNQGGNELEARSIRGSDEEFLENFLRASRELVDYKNTIFAELPQGQYHLELRIYVDTSADQVFERRRDVRRSPFLEAYRSHRPEWATRVFMNKDLGLKSLMVPLVELGRILGYWIVNFDKDTKLSQHKLKLIEVLANQASIALDRRRLYQQTRPAQNRALLPSPSVLLAELHQTRQTAASLVQSQYRVDGLFERLPVGVLVATLWGEVEQINAEMRRLLKDASIDDPAQMNLAALISTISNDDEEHVRTLLRQAMDARSPLRIAPQSQSGHGPSQSGFLATHELILSRVSGSGLGDDDDTSAAAHFVLTANERPSAASRSGWLQDVSAPADAEVAKVVDIMSKTGSGRN